jgi:hypothetical protein
LCASTFRKSGQLHRIKAGAHALTMIYRHLSILRQQQFKEVMLNSKWT